VFKGGNRGFDAATAQRLTELTAVIGFVSNQLLGTRVRSATLLWNAYDWPRPGERV
jgi:hypothetical protein